MSRRLTIHSRRVFWALACALGLVLAACSGSSGDLAAPNDPGPPQGPPPTQPPPNQPPPDQPPAQQPPTQSPGITGTYVLTQINNSQPGQMVTITNPDGKVFGIYRFDATTQLTLDALQTFELQLRYRDEKGQYGYDDHGEFKSPGEVDGTLALSFTSADYDDAFTGIAVDGVVVIEYDFDGDGQIDTTFGFQRVG